MLFLMDVSNIKKLNLLGWQCVIYHKSSYRVALLPYVIKIILITHD